MLAWWIARRDRRRREERAIQRAVEEFKVRRGFAPMAGHVLCIDPGAAIVRVMHLTDHLPPDRAWFLVSEGSTAIREVAFEEVAHLEKPWR